MTTIVDIEKYRKEIETAKAAKEKGFNWKVVYGSH